DFLARDLDLNLLAGLERQIVNHPVERPEEALDRHHPQSPQIVAERLQLPASLDPLPAQRLQEALEALAQGSHCHDLCLWVFSGSDPPEARLERRDVATRLGEQRNRLDLRLLGDKEAAGIREEPIEPWNRDPDARVEGHGHLRTSSRRL